MANSHPTDGGKVVPLDAGRDLPKVHLIAKNRIIQYMGSAPAYAAVLRSIDHDVGALLESHPDIFTLAKREDGVVDIRDFQTTGVGRTIVVRCAFRAKQKPLIASTGVSSRLITPRRRMKPSAVDSCPL